MLLPKTIYARVDFNPLDGIINKIKKYSDDPISDNIVVPSALQSGWGSCNYSITWDGNFASLSGENKNYLIIRFPERYLFPTHYTIRGTSVAYHYQKTWTVHGYNKGEENNKDSWTLLADNESTFDTFCGNEEGCITTRRSTIFSMIPSKKGFEYIRFTTTSTITSGDHFTTSGIEFFGILSSLTNPASRQCRNTIMYKCTLRNFQFFFKTLTAIAISIQ